MQNKQRGESVFSLGDFHAFSQFQKNRRADKRNKKIRKEVGNKGAAERNEKGGEDGKQTLQATDKTRCIW